MRASPILLILLVGLVPIIPLAIWAAVAYGPQQVRWQPIEIWSSTPGSGDLKAYSVDSTGIYATGIGSLARFDLTGKNLWTRQFGIEGYYLIPQVVSVAAGGVYIAGVNYTDELTKGSISVFVQKYDNNGNKVWSVMTPDDWYSTKESGYFGGGWWGMSGDDYGLYLAWIPDRGSPVPSPPTIRHYDSSGAISWTRTLTNRTEAPGISDTVLISAVADGVYLAGSDVFINYTTNTHAFISKLDGLGNTVWTRSLDSSGSFCSCRPFGLSADSSGVYFGGWTAKSLQGENSFGSGGSYLRKYDPNGNVLWTNGNAGSSMYQVFPGGSSVYARESGITAYAANSGNMFWSFSTGGVLETAFADGFLTSGSNGLVKYTPSASLVLFGINPPYSFLMVAVPLVIIPGSLLLRKLMMRMQEKLPPSLVSELSA